MKRKTTKEPQLEFKIPPTCLRDYFAAHVLCGLVSTDGTGASIPGKDIEDCTLGEWQKHFAAVSYQYADAMMAERAK